MTATSKIDNATLLGKLLHPLGNMIDGEWRAPKRGGVFEVEEPATARHLTDIPASTAEDIDDAVSAARRSFEMGTWARMVPSERGRILLRLAAMIRENAEALSVTETRDSGKPIRETRLDIAATADIFEYYAGAASKIVGQTLPLPDYQLGMLLRSPIGVVGAITPWNFPILVGAWKVAPALACGNSVILKPSELASLTCLTLGGLAIEAGVPAGVFNVVAGTGEGAGAPLAAHPDVDLLAFTGGVVTGRKVMTARAQNALPVQLELGGKSPNVVFDDADFDRAVAGAAFGIFYAQGENCNAGSRVIVQSGTYGRFVEALAQFAQKIIVAAPTDEGSQIGALISKPHLEKVARYVEIGVEEGARLVTGGRTLTDASLGGGYFYAPTVLADVQESFRVFREEIFGPVVVVTPFRDEAEAIRLANATDYGLAAGVWTANVERALRCVQEIKSGYVWVNTFNGTPIEAPFGGVKRSGFGRDCGMQALENYMTWKTVAWATAPFSDWYA